MAKPQLPQAGVEFLEQCLEATQKILNNWLLFNQVLLSYNMPGADKSSFEMQFLQIKSQLAREISVLKGRIGKDCTFDNETIGVIAGSPSLHQVYSQSEVAVKKLQGEWHRCYIAINEMTGDLYEMRRRVEAGEKVIFAGKLIKIQKPLPWKRIGASVVVVVCLGLSLYFMRYFLGYWAPGEGVGYEAEAGMSDDEQINMMIVKMKSAFDRRDLDTMMSAFADDFQDVEGRNKTMLRALIQSFAATGSDAVGINIDDARVTLEGERATVTPVYLRAPDVNLTLMIEGQKRNGAWLVTYINGV